MTNGVMLVGNTAEGAKSSALYNSVFVEPGAAFAAKKLYFGSWTSTATPAYHAFTATNATLAIRQTSAFGEAMYFWNGITVMMSGCSVSGQGRINIANNRNTWILRDGVRYDNAGLMYINGRQNTVEITGTNTLFVTRDDHFGLSIGGTSNSVLLAYGAKWEARNLLNIIGRNSKYNSFVVRGGCLDVSSWAIVVGADNVLHVEDDSTVNADTGIKTSGTMSVQDSTVNAGVEITATGSLSVQGSTVNAASGITATGPLSIQDGTVKTEGTGITISGLCISKADGWTTV